MQKHIVILPLLVLLSGCVSSYVQEPPSWDPKARESIHVIAQVCLPSTTYQKYLSVSRVRTYGPGGNMRSILGGFEQHSWSTTTGQSVFEFAVTRPIDFLALIISIDEDDFTFTPPQNVPSVGWSEWVKPESKNPRSAQMDFIILGGHSYAHIPPGPNAPKARYRLVRIWDYKVAIEREMNHIAEDAIPPC
ncbi:MAG: hypothetical protein KKF58_06080 [Gammaproteobacteria bacterium]|nr:hypothetical protein [Gammaproteobacteria bacterium]